jgi:hypothetical protein
MNFTAHRRKTIRGEGFELRTHELTERTIDEPFDDRSGPRTRERENLLARNQSPPVVDGREKSRLFERRAVESNRPDCRATTAYTRIEDCVSNAEL